MRVARAWPRRDSLARGITLGGILGCVVWAMVAADPGRLSWLFGVLALGVIGADLFGTGTGALLLALLSELPNARGVGTDISAAALSIARENAARLALGQRADFVLCNYGAALHAPFDVVVSNPPYIPTADIAGLHADVRCYDPPSALDGGSSVPNVATNTGVDRPARSR